MAAEADSGLATLIGVDEDGAVPIVAEGGCDRGCGPGLSVVRVRLRELKPLVAGLGPDDLLIAIAAGARAQQELLPAGIAGAGYDGDLTSASTRTDGVVISTDIAPTVLEHFGVDVPDEVNGSVIESGSERDPAGVADLQARLDHRPSRDTVVLLPLAIWLALTGLAALVLRRRGATAALQAAGAGGCLGAGDPARARGARRRPARLGARDRARRPSAGAARPAPARRPGRPRARLRGQRRRLRARRGRRLAADRALGARPEPGRRGPLLRDRQRARGDPHHPDPDRHRRLARDPPGRARAPARGDLVRRRRRWSRSPPSRRGGSAPTSAPRSCSGVGAATAAVIALGLRPRRAILVVAGGGALALAALFCVDLVLGGAHLSSSVLGAGGARRRARRARPARAADGPHLRPPGLSRAARSPAWRCSSPEPSYRRRGGRLVRRARGRRWRASLGALAGRAGRHARQRLRLGAAGDRDDLPRGQRRASSGRPPTDGTDGLVLSPRLPSPRARSDRHALLLDISGGREPARRSARRRADRPRPRASRACPLGPTRPPQPGCFTAAIPSPRSCPTIWSRSRGPRRSAPTAPVSNLGIFPDGVTAMRRELRAFDPDVVHVHEPPRRSARAGTPAPTPAPRSSAPSTPTRPSRCPTTSPRSPARAASSTSSPARIAVSEAAAWTGRRWFGGATT